MQMVTKHISRSTDCIYSKDVSLFQTGEVVQSPAWKQQKVSEPTRMLSKSEAKQVHCFTPVLGQELFPLIVEAFVLIFGCSGSVEMANQTFEAENIAWLLASA